MKTRLAISHSITRTGKRKDHHNGMAKPEPQRVAQGYNSWIRLIYLINNYSK